VSRLFQLSNKKGANRVEKQQVILCKHVLQNRAFVFFLWETLLCGRARPDAGNKMRVHCKQLYDFSCALVLTANYGDETFFPRTVQAIRRINRDENQGRERHAHQQVSSVLPPHVLPYLALFNQLQGAKFQVENLLWRSVKFG